MKTGNKWFQYFTPSSYSLVVVVGEQFGEVQDVITVNTSTDLTVTKCIEDIYDFSTERKYNCMVDLLASWVALQVAIYLTFKFVSHSTT
ncbi:hypothetical protein JG688_00017844 [Phytophthora aleatoria]|uniref:Uncharacterized protein n=1 Tax=Phytophthora aleatoria TaxID=2496075 RepID=A0A8J5ID43_9STRA|nr:hypothetical protein JG688_00017844 [Phytophthora aleatoria]